MATPPGDDTFELEPRPVGRARRPWPAVLAVAAAGLSVVIVAALAGGVTEAPIRAVASSQASAAVGSPVPAVVAAVSSRPMPSMTCHGLDRPACRLAVATALATLDADVPAVESAEVWSGLVCGDTLDCPRDRLDGRTTPLANVILRLVGGGPAAWVNVVYRSHGRPLDFDPTLEAWIARWQAQP
jgi:hypothetical protein